MKFLVSVVETQPVVLHFSIVNPRTSEKTIYVPRLLRPLGYFIRLKISDFEDRLVYRTHVPKAKPKLHPDRQDSYLAIDPGYSYGAVLEVEDFTPAAGTYQLALSYSNREYLGFSDHPLGEITCRIKLSFEVSD